jgi:integrase
MRPATGQVIERKRGRGVTFALRFRAYGKRHYVTLGKRSEGWTRKRAEQELGYVMADVGRGVWRPPAPDPEPEAPRAEPTFHEFATEYLEARRADGLSRRTLDSLEWALSCHLLPHFARFRLSAITIEEVDRYRRAKVAEAEQRRKAIADGKPLTERYTDKRGKVYARALRPLSPGTINKTLKVLAAVLDQAIEYGRIPTRDGHAPANPARGSRRRLKADKSRPVHLDGVDQLVAMLDAARELDADAKRHTTGRHALVACLMFAGPRAGEAGGLLVRDLDLARARIEVGRSKTDAGMRSIDLLPVLRDVLAEHKAGHRGGLDAPLFPTATGGHRDKDNLRKRVLEPVIRRADELLGERGQQPLPRGVTPHKLRHTFASILVALGRDPAYVMAQLGHTDPAFTLRVYAHAMRRDEGDKERLKALVEGRDWAPLGTTAPNEGPAGVQQHSTGNEETPASAGVPEVGAAGFEPATSRV